MRGTHLGFLEVLKLLYEFGSGNAIPSRCFLPVQNVRLKTWQNLKYAKHFEVLASAPTSNFEIAQSD
jgi:hypothetical protein